MNRHDQTNDGRENVTDGWFRVGLPAWALKKEEPCPPGMRRLERPKPPSGYCHYSNPDSRGSLIVETPDFPPGYRPAKEEYFCTYSYRIAGWDLARFKAACDIAGGGDQTWAYRLPGLPMKALLEFAKVALGLAVQPKHVRVVHHYNVSNGFSCPTVEAIWDKVTPSQGAEK